jgi:hypothetical protein
VTIASGQTTPAERVPPALVKQFQGGLAAPKLCHFSPLAGPA